MKTLDEVPGSWHRVLDATNGDATGCDSDRFRCVMSGQAVLDLETGLVWDRQPSTITYAWSLNPCFNRSVDGKGGWRLPRVSELMSLTVWSNGDYSFVSGHPFVLNGGPGTRWWASTESATSSGFAYFFEEGSVAGTGDKTLLHRHWCVRGPAGAGVDR